MVTFGVTGVSGPERTESLSHNQGPITGSPGAETNPSWRSLWGGEGSGGALLFHFSSGPEGMHLPGPKLGIPAGALPWKCVREQRPAGSGAKGPRHLAGRGDVQRHQEGAPRAVVWTAHSTAPLGPASGHEGLWKHLCSPQAGPGAPNTGTELGRWGLALWGRLCFSVSSTSPTRAPLVSSLGPSSDCLHPGRRWARHCSLQ